MWQEDIKKDLQAVKNRLHSTKKIIIKRVLWEFMGASSHGDAIYNIAP